MDVIKFLENLQTTSGLLILLHGVISLQDATSYDNVLYKVTLVTGKLNIVSLGLLLDASPLEPRCSLNNDMSLQKYVKGIFGLG